ncbi:unnamed protein product [Moneuplotes crassus]|uniref:Battenin n=1 Tax=Euplotes crassus TaxID=5936 RepID=A0AAD1XCT4_EUPCR|nr:unnamed protein product [Moneuplotes crassus]
MDDDTPSCMSPSTQAKLQFTIQGLINSFGFFLLLSSSESIALFFGQKNLVPMLTFSASFGNVVILFINAIWLVKYSPRLRLLCNATFMFIGYAIITIGCFINFYFVIFGALFVGIGSAWGQVIHYGFIRRFPSEYVGPFSSGTGMCGLFSSMLYMILNDYGVADWVIFACLMPLAIIYAFNFLELHNLYENSRSFNYLLSEMTNSNEWSEDLSQDYKDSEEDKVETKNQTVWQAYWIDPWNHPLIFLLYFFEYIIITCFFDRLAQLRNSFESDVYLERNLYTVSQFLYQVGVLTARSTLYCYKSKATGKISIVMFILCIVYFGFALWYVDVDRYILLILALFTGLFGGWGYLFSYYRVLDDSRVTKENREILINYLAVCADFGSFIATGLATIISNTILEV